jgi:hypothetical protein
VAAALAACGLVAAAASQLIPSAFVAGRFQASLGARGPVAQSADSQRLDGAAFPQGLAAGAVLLATAAGLQKRPRRTRTICAAADEEAPALVSERDVDYTKLKELLESSDFRGADAETRRLLIELGGPAAVKRGWVYYIEVKGIPEVDMTTIDDLWQFYSKGKFGFAQQKKIWKQSRQQFDKFALQVSWFTDTWKNRNWPDEFVYNLDAPAGHLPLTNCIRGAQVLQEILEHPAYAKKKVKMVSSSSSSSKPAEKAEAGKRKSALDML